MKKKLFLVLLCSCILGITCIALALGISQKKSGNTISESITQKNFKPFQLNLDKTWNTRELGGYKTVNNLTTKDHAFLRSDKLYQLTQRDVQSLKNYGVKTVIDLREPYELEKKPDSLESVEGIKYYNIFFDLDSVNEKFKNVKPRIWSDEYIYMMEQQKEVFKKIYETMALAEDGTILFHCSAGRDRTGIVAMTLLGLAGVNEENITADYILSHENMRKKYGDNGDDGIPIPSDDILRGYVKPVINYIVKTYGSFENYLLSCKLSKETIQIVKNKI